MDRIESEVDRSGRFPIPGVGLSAEPAERLRQEERPYGTPVRFPEEAAGALEADLRAHVAGEVRFDAGSRALYATDGSNYRQVPIGVVIPQSADDVIATVAACRRHGAPLLSRGGGTSLAGQCCNVAVVMDFSKRLHQLLSLDPQGRTAWVEPGLVLDDLRAAAERHHLTFGPDPATHNHCTIGGMIGNNSCGIHAMMAGRTVDNVHALDVLLYDGTRMQVGPTSPEELEAAIRTGGRRGDIYRRLRDLRDRYGDLIRQRYPKIPRRVSGYSLDELLPENGFNVARSLVGSEGSCVTILRAQVQLVPSPPGRALLVLGYPDIYAAGDHVPEIREFRPIGLEAIDDRLVSDIRKKHLHTERTRLLPQGRGWLLVEFGGADQREAEAIAERCMAALRQRPDAPSMKLYDDPEEERTVWLIRESGLGATARVPGQPDTWEGWEDSAVPPDKVGVYLRELRKLYEKFGYDGALYGHFGQGCIHTRITFDLASHQGILDYRHFIEEAADLVVSLGGSLSGEHGDGQSRAELLYKMYGPDLVRAFEEFKSIWDPEWKMNPGKKVRPYRLDENLRLGEGYQELRPPTRFRFVDDDGSFGRATARCVGVGECRREQGGVMCPSYRVTREEKHSTRGRAHLLFEMLEGNPVRGGWRSEEVKDALSLCLSCKGCKSDCPMNVDMATYKAEFLSHYYAGRLRPRHAYAMGLIMYWARLASLAPRVANFLAHAPGLSRLAKLAGGLAPERRIPSFAPFTFRQWFQSRPTVNPGGRPVLLFVDTFNDFFHPGTAIAAVEVLEANGYRVAITDQRICCGRPLFDYGMLDLARRLLRNDVEALAPWVARGVPVVGLEPSCVAVFRDELVGLLAGDPVAEDVSRSVLVLSEFIERERERFRLPRLSGKAIMQGHCHHHAVMKLDAEKRVLSRLGLELEPVDAGCCGMAGSFGFEAGDPYRVSVAQGERVLLPAVRAASQETLILADGFSCREQIAQGTDRRGLHLAELLRLGIERSPALGRALPEKAIVGRLPRLPLRARVRRSLPALTAVAVVVGLAAWRISRRSALRAIR